MTKVKRLLAGGSASFLVATAIVAGTVAVAAPAQATTQSCQNYLAGKGYTVGSGVKRACNIGHGVGGPADWLTCNQLLVDLGVRAAHARTACDRAAN
ncbi:hypothetical protein [Streptomyces mirabilis]|uniref:hypothetical protein n=1 Tax=Streptomyces mirabilis TaxID=68239 RepID=UPI003688D4AA